MPGQSPLPLSRRGRTVSSDGGGGCYGGRQPAGTTKSILKSQDSLSAGQIPTTTDNHGPSSSSHLLLSADHSGHHHRQHSMDANGGGRAVKFFLESEGGQESSESSFPDKTDVLPHHQSPSSGVHNHHHRSSRHMMPKLQQNAAFRRTSLPVQFNVTRQNLLLQSQVNSARGILMDLLATNRRDLSPSVTAYLKAVTALLNPASPTGAQPQQQCEGIGTVSASGGNLSLFDLGVPPIVESPYSGEVHISMTSKPRVSNITFSTVTSATGLPTIAAEPSRPRSSSYWKPSQHSQQQQQYNNNHHLDEDDDHHSDEEDESERRRRSVVLPNGESHHRQHSRNKLLSNQEEQHEEDNGDTICATLTGKSVATGAKVVAVVGGEHHPSGRRKQQDTTRAERRAATTTTAPHASTPPPGPGKSAAATTRPGDDMTGQPKGGSRKSLEQTAPEGSATMTVPVQRHSSARFSPTAGRKSAPKVIPTADEECCSSEQSSSPDDPNMPSVYKTVDGTVYDRVELERDPSLRQVQEWSFPIFRFADKHKRTVLSRLTYAIFKESDLFRTFKISYAKFFNYFHALEAGYWDIPYHNRIHAADVLHGTYYLTCHPVHAFCGYHSSELDDEDDFDDPPPESSSAHPELDNHHNPSHCDTGEGCAGSGEAPQIPLSARFADHQHQHQSVDSATALPLAQSMSPLELMALYTAASMHDYDHPGRTNAFLVASEDRKAILYNDRSVLENHHAAESWRLLTSQTQNHFIENLDSAETKRFRYLVLEYILATDLKQHFDIIMQFNERAPDMDLSNEADRVLVSLMLIKFADINSPAKPYGLHRQWTERICQEFYEQGDEEKDKHMAVSPYMDRNEPAVAKLQDSFIAHIVNPLAIALNEAGLFPILPGLPESELIINLKHNHQKWLQQIEAEQQENNVGTASSNSNNRGAGGEAAIALNSNGVKLPMGGVVLHPGTSNNTNCSLSSVPRKISAKGHWRARAATATTSTTSPSATTVVVTPPSTVRSASVAGKTANMVATAATTTKSG